MDVGRFSVFFFNGRRVVQIASVPLFLLAASVALARAFLPRPPSFPSYFKAIFCYL